MRIPRSRAFAGLRVRRHYVSPQRDLRCVDQSVSVQRCDPDGAY